MIENNQKLAEESPTRTKEETKKGETHYGYV
jgi:hypothetical protein